MKSLQLVTPAKPCIYNCPFCIAKSHPHNNHFANNYENHYEEWEKGLRNILSSYKDLKTVVITGTSEPMQEEACVLSMIQIIREERGDIQIEIQTRFYRPSEAFNRVDITAFSVSQFSFLDQVPIPASLIRVTIILTDSFNGKTLQDILRKMPKEVRQVTCKVLHDSNGYNKNMDNWIDKHRTNQETVEDLKKSIQEYIGKLSLFFDDTCMNAENRYMVYREDGHLYENYDSKEAIL